MPVPRNRHSNARKNSKRSHHAKKPKIALTCSNCDSPKRPHTICTGCGAYGNGLVYAAIAKEQA